jgi:hypothetical protein
MGAIEVVSEEPTPVAVWQAVAGGTIDDELLHAQRRERAEDAGRTNVLPLVSPERNRSHVKARLLRMASR